MLRRMFLFVIMILLSPIVFGEVIGDVNGDGSINIADVVYLFKHRDVGLEKGDLNCDNSVDIADVVYLFNNYQKWREPVVFAKNFKIEYYDTNGNPVNYNENWAYKIITTEYNNKVYNKYCIVKDGEKLPSNLPPDVKVIYAPVKKVCTLNAFQIAMLEALDDDNVRKSIKGVSEYTYIKIKDYGVFPKLKPYVDNGDIVPIGKWGSINKEVLLNINPDIIFIPWTHSYLAKDIATVSDLGINYLVTIESNEPDFLAKAEWAKVYAAFYNLDKKGNDFLQKVWKKRNELVRKTRKATYRPKVAMLYWSPYSGPWVYCAQNYCAKWILEVKGDYCFLDIPGTSYVNLDKETTLEHIKGCDVFIYMNWNSLKEPMDTLEELKERRPDLAPVLDSAKRVYTTKFSYSYDGNVNMDLLIEDFARMVHPECFDDGDSKLHYFKKLK
ncbi:periplasmic binding protein [Methanocaldococcus infernus ME]|uniref:Periplasmic binding protein n=1 Tax=Methanocaldococcus infernus (strain DSM 11812 / JCM 15783 / ME) TaxID=573063 RepID=D5VU12_METIM|nr:ABC transporter substrate-binding protein [Methanocaldococcus infernus]ADG14065.1 periplasmic binding protein [Methanocaldococcus infernus ME]